MIPGIDPDNIVYLNGAYERLGDARISVLDRGFIFGDGIYDVVPCYQGKPFCMEDHLARLMVLHAKGLALITGRHVIRSEEHTSELQSRGPLSCRLLPAKKNQSNQTP